MMCQLMWIPPNFGQVSNLMWIVSVGQADCLTLCGFYYVYLNNNKTPRPKNKYICVFQVSALKNLGMVGRHNISFCQNILYRNYMFQYIVPHFSANLTTFAHNSQ